MCYINLCFTYLLTYLLAKSVKDTMILLTNTGIVGLDCGHGLGANYKKILRLSYDVIITYDNRKSNLR